MTIRKTAATQKQFSYFGLIKDRCSNLLVYLVILLTFSGYLAAQPDGVIVSNDFEEIKPDIITPTTKTNEALLKTPNKLAPNDIDKETVEVIKTTTLKTETPTREEKESVPGLLPPKTGSNTGTIEQKKQLEKLQTQLQQLTQKVSNLTQQNQDLDSKLSLLQKTFEAQANTNTPTTTSNQSKHPVLKAQVIKLAIATSLLKPETLSTEVKQQPKKESAWYEKLIVVKKIDKNQKTPLYTVLKQFDLLQLALDESNQQQWQETLQIITGTLQSQYPNHAQEIIQQLKSLQSNDITNSKQPNNVQTIDAKFGIK